MRQFWDTPYMRILNFFIQRIVLLSAVSLILIAAFYELGDLQIKMVFKDRWDNNRNGCVTLIFRAFVIIPSVNKGLASGLFSSSSVIFVNYIQIKISEVMVKLIEESFGIALKVLQILGFYSTEKYKLLYKIYSYGIYCICTIPVPTLATLYLIIGENVDFAQISESAFLISEAGCFIAKFFPFVSNGEQVKESFYILERSIFTSYTKIQEKIIQEFVSICKRNCIMNLSFCIVAYIGWATTPLFRNKGNRTFPVQIWLPFDAISETKTYFFTYVFVAIAVGNGAISNGAIDPLISGLACHATGQLKVLKDNLQKLGKYADEEVLKITRGFAKVDDVKLEHLRAQIIYKKIKQCIEHYGAILNFVNNFEKIYSSTVFTQFMASALVLCNACLQLSMVQPFTYQFYAMILFLATMLLKNYLYSYYGTKLYEESNTLTNAIYMGKWYEYDLVSKKALIILMERSKKPMIITAGKILEISLVTFTTIIRRAYSLLAVLKNY